MAWKALGTPTRSASRMAAISPHARMAAIGAAMRIVGRTVKKRAMKYAKHMPTSAPASWAAARPSTKASSGEPARGVMASAIGRRGASGSATSRPDSVMTTAAQTYAPARPAMRPR